MVEWQTFGQMMVTSVVTHTTIEWRNSVLMQDHLRFAVIFRFELWHEHSEIPICAFWLAEYAVAQYRRRFPSWAHKLLNNWCSRRPTKSQFSKDLSRNFGCLIITRLIKLLTCSLSRLVFLSNMMSNRVFVVSASIRLARCASDSLNLLLSLFYINPCSIPVWFESFHQTLSKLLINFLF